MRRLGAGLLVFVVLAAVAAAGYAIRAVSEPEVGPAPTIPTETVAVVRTDLVQYETLRGTLEYAGEADIRSAVPGTVTWLPDEASRLDRGDTAFELDGAPVFVMIGDRPAWRSLGEGIADGADVEQLELNLRALGFGPEDWEPDQEFDDDTADAVEQWREEQGLEDDAMVELGRVVFIPEPTRVGALSASIGQPVAVGSPVFSTTTFEQEVVIDLDPDDLELVAEGDAVTVVLPDDREIPGRVAEIGKVVVPVGPEPGSSEVVKVRVELAESGLDLDQAPVDVEVESERANDVLAVPVRALIALSDGGYAVEVDGRLIGVETGEFAGGLVEVTGALGEGDLVVVPR